LGDMAQRLRQESKDDHATLVDPGR
jgi:hypothetical protein